MEKIITAIRWPSSLARLSQSMRSAKDITQTEQKVPERQAGYRQTRRITRVPFVPPKPKEFLSATSIRIGRAVLAQ